MKRERCSVMLLTTKQLTEETAEKINAINKEYFPRSANHISVRNLAHVFKNGGDIIIARTTTGKIVGFAYLSIDVDLEHYELRIVRKLLVKREYLRTKLGQEILELLIKEAKVGRNSTYLIIPFNCVGKGIARTELQKFGFQKAEHTYQIALQW